MLGCLCCAGQACCGCLCGCCIKAFGTTMGQNVRMGFIVLTAMMLGIGVFAVAIGPTISDQVDHIGLVDCSGEGTECIGVSTVYRISFALGVFFLLMVLVCLVGGSFQKMIEGGCWFFKVLVILSIFGLSYFIPRDDFVRFM